MVSRPENPGAYDLFLFYSFLRLINYYLQLTLALDYLHSSTVWTLNLY